jgi:hypothetical protein
MQNCTLSTVQRQKRTFETCFWYISQETRTIENQ